MVKHTPGHQDLVILEADRQFPDLGLRAVRERGDLLLFLARRDIKVRYQQTFFGLLWALIQPLIMVAIFWVVFGKFVRVDTGSIPYPLFGLAGLIVWNLFTQSVTAASSSLHNHREMIGKIYFPRLLLPLTAVATSCVDFLVALCLLLILMAVFLPLPGLEVLWAIPAVIISLMAATGLGAALAALVVIFRDLRQLVPVIAQVGLLATPIAYSVRAHSEPIYLLYYLNPMAGMVTLFRHALLGTEMPSMPALIVSCGSAIVLFIGGLLVFRALERRLPDIV